MKKLILTEGTEFEQNLKPLALIDTDDRAGKPIMIDDVDLFYGISNADPAVQAMVGTAIQSMDANLTTENIKKDVTIFGVTGSYERPEEPNLVAENIKKGVTIYGVTGTYEGETPAA